MVKKSTYIMITIFVLLVLFTFLFDYAFPVHNLSLYEKISFYLQGRPFPVLLQIEPLFPPDNLPAIIGFADYMFVGKVTKHLGNFAPPDPREGMPIPFNRYHVEVLENIKGKLEKKVEITKKGGYVKKWGATKQYIYDCGGDPDCLPDVGKTYLFIAVAGQNSELSVLVTGGQVLIDGDDAKAIVDKYKDAFKNEIPYERERFNVKYSR